MLDAFVSKSGTYATTSVGSHADDIVIENGSGGTDWATIANTDFSRSRTQIGFYTVPLGKTAFIHSFSTTIDSTKSADILAVFRANILETAAPFTAMCVILELGGVTGQDSQSFKLPTQPFPALTDIGLLGKIASGTTQIDVTFTLILIED